MKKRGFTLIELLAVIVVLAIIALIATPIIMNVIKKTNEGAAERSADNYVKAVETLIATEKLDGTPVEDGTYKINGEGNLDFGDVEVSGTKPIGGTIVVKDGKVVKDESSITVGDYTVTFEDGVAKAEATETGASKKIASLSDCNYVSGTEGEVGAKYTCDLGDGERNFYVLEVGSNPITNSILKSNEVALILEGNYDMETLAWCASGEDNACAADGLTTKLDEIAEAWNKLERSQIGIPSVEQIMVADGREEDAYLNYVKLTSNWLYKDNETWRNEVIGYWTSTPYSNDIADYAWYVVYNGNVYEGLVNIDFDFGVRPVITLSI